METENHKAGSQEPVKVSQQRARSKKDQGLGVDNTKMPWTLASKSGDGVGYLNTQGPT